MMKIMTIDIPITPIFEQNLNAILEPCPECGSLALKTCPWCAGSGKKYRYIINEGSSRSGKTFSIADCMDWYATQIPNKRGTIWRETKIDVKRTLLDDMIRHHRNTNRWEVMYKYNRTESIFQYSNGSTLEMQGADEENKVHGMNQDFAWLNEPYKISKEIFNQIKQRTSDFLFLDWNPKEQHWIDDLKKDPRSYFIWSTFKDNPFCPPEQRAEILSYQPVSECYLVKEKILGETEARKYDIGTNPDNFSNKHIKELTRCILNEERNSANVFNWYVYALGVKGERPNRIFNWEAIPYDKFMAIDGIELYGVDWGKVDAWGILFAKYYDGSLYLHELNYASENEIMATLSPSEIETIRQSDEGIVTWLFDKLNIEKSSIIICDNNRVEKIRALRKNGYDSAMRATKGSGSIIEGIDLLSKIKVYYTNTSKNLEVEQEKYSRKVDRYGIVLEEPEDKDNHLIDPARYLVTFLRNQGYIKKI